MKKTCLLFAFSAFIIILCIGLSSCGEHKHAFDEWNTLKEATCSEKGTKQRVCACGEKETEFIDTLSHTEIRHEAKSPTCTEYGYDAYVTCSTCNYTTYKEISANGHTEVTDAAIEATCTENGKTEGMHCSVCKTVLIQQKLVIAKGHTVVSAAPIAATCTTKGMTGGKYCSECNIIIEKQEDISAKGHSVVINRAIDPTCTTDGKTASKYCSVCGEIIVQQKVVKKINPSGHDYGDWTVLQNATATQEGSREHTCKICKYTEQKVIDKRTYNGYYGSAGHISETTIIVSVFANDAVTSWNPKSDLDNETINAMHGNLTSAITWIRKQCGKYNVSTDFIYDWKKHSDLRYTIDFSQDFSNLNYDSIGSIERSLIKHKIDGEKLKQKYNAQNIIYILYFNQSNRAWASIYRKNANHGIELVNIYAERSSITYNATAPASTVAHEILHCFGAYDLYEASSAIPKEYVEHCRQNGSKDIMYATDPGYEIQNVFTDLCAYYIGLINSCSEVTQWGLRKSDYLI